jgi:hypothetical protein
MGVSARLISTDRTRVPRPREAGWRSFCSHTHMTRGSLQPPESHRGLVAWCRTHGIDAIGVGSPWTPANEATYLRYEGPDRALYYSGAVDQRGLREEQEVLGCIADLNARSGGDTLFYLDNETPKGRYGHMWWLGWSYDVPAWHDYDHPFDRWMLAMSAPGHFHDEPMPYERRPYLEIVGAQRSSGALGIWAHPTSWWWSGQHTFVTNIASEMPFHLFAEGSIDGMVIMGYKAWQQPYLDLWFRFLDLGYRVAGLAEVDIGLSEEHYPDAPFLNWCAPSARHVGHREIADAVRSRRIFASNGPFVDVELDGQPMGSVVAAATGRAHRLTIRAGMPGDAPCRVMVFTTGGHTVWDQRAFPGGTLELEVPDVSARTWFVCCVLDDSASLPQGARSAAIANPVWLEPRPDVPPPAMSTELSIDFSRHSPWQGGTVHLESASGTAISSWPIRPDQLRQGVPAASRITLESADGWRKTSYLLNLNAEAQRLQRYLYRGQFLEGYPGAGPGEVPVEAFELARCRAALESLSLTM